MHMNKKVKVAAVQFHVGSDIQANLATALRMIDTAMNENPQLVVLPEFVNHCSWYDESDPTHCFKVSVELEGDFLKQIAAKAVQHAIYLVINVTVQRAEGKCSGTSLLYGPDGQLLGQADKQVLIGHENFHLQRAQQNSPIIETPIGRIGLYACMDGVVNETPRGLALRGAQILCNSLNSFAFDEASLHIPVRAAENRVFIVAANKVGPLIPAELVEPVGQAINIPGHYLSGAGESQIVAPDGTVIAKAPVVGEAVVYADIDVSHADDKRRLDGTDIFASRRPDLYQSIATSPTQSAQESAQESAQDTVATIAADEIKVASFQPQYTGEKAIEEMKYAVEEAAKQGVHIMAMPELFMLAEPSLDTPQATVSWSQRAVEEFTSLASQHTMYIATSILKQVGSQYSHQGILIGPEGVVLQQEQLHANTRYQGQIQLGQALKVVQLPFAKVALIVGDDSIYPETFRLASIQGAELIIAPLHLQETWEVELGLPERAAENRMCILVAARPNAIGASMFFDLWDDYTLMTPWKERLFDGTISAPLVHKAPRYTGLFTHTVHPKTTANKILSPMTHVVESRPWHLASAITAPITSNG